MKLLDPSRPTSPNGLPLYLWQGKPVAVMPHWQISPSPFIDSADQSGYIDIEIMLLTAPNNGTWFRTVADPGMFHALWESWCEDPEQIMLTQFKWPGFWPGKPQPRGDVLTLGDLGL